MSAATKSYLGDGAYVELNQWGQLVLSTEDGLQVTNTIYLEPEVWGRLIAFVEERQRAATLCSICRRTHGPEVEHAAE